MCIICYKPKNKPFPNKQTIKAMFENNPDGAGYMYSDAGKVHIRKGFTTLQAFRASLDATREKIGDAAAFVLHFRISTQAHGRVDCTHPFPLSAKMDELRKLKTACDVGIAHNGIIQLTSKGYNKTITYSDTMEFITDYLSLILTQPRAPKDAGVITLINRLCGGRLAILDAKGNCTLTGSGWVNVDGVYYSNTSYIARPSIIYYPTYKSAKSYTYNQQSIFQTTALEAECKDYCNYKTCCKCPYDYLCYGAHIDH